MINLEPALSVAGRVQNEQGVIHSLAEAISPLPADDLLGPVSHDHH